MDDVLVDLPHARDVVSGITRKLQPELEYKVVYAYIENITHYLLDRALEVEEQEFPQYAVDGWCKKVDVFIRFMIENQVPGDVLIQNIIMIQSLSPVKFEEEVMDHLPLYTTLLVSLQ